MITPKAWLRLEGLVVFVACVLLYRELDSGWLLFILLFLVPDVSFLGYLRGPKFGSLIYNLFHTYLWPVGLVLFGFFASDVIPTALGLIWAAHIGIDRTLGFGLKAATGFHDTHLTSR